MKYRDEIKEISLTQPVVALYALDGLEMKIVFDDIDDEERIELNELIERVRYEKMQEMSDL